MDEKTRALVRITEILVLLTEAMVTEFGRLNGGLVDERKSDLTWDNQEDVPIHIFFVGCYVYAQGMRSTPLLKLLSFRRMTNNNNNAKIITNLPPLLHSGAPR